MAVFGKGKEKSQNHYSPESTVCFMKQTQNPHIQIYEENHSNRDILRFFVFHSLIIPPMHLSGMAHVMQGTTLPIMRN